MKAIALIFACALALVLQGCGSVVIPTVAMLSATSPLEADPAGFEIAIDIPDGVGVREDGAVLEFSMARSDTGEAVAADYVLQRRVAVDGRSLFRVFPDDLDDLRATQATALDWETDAPEATTGSFGVAVALCRIGAGPDPDDTYSVSIRTTPDGPFLPLIRNASVADTIDQIETLDLEDRGDVFSTDAPCE